ncbi:hypothetical protein EUGRSUZ_L01431 [Eucalyptus grandis]|uniref:Uncharacterized protein n=1 Tax=Eucalyptus grandis TaxID=71139 RepID=A0A058ZU86_EUCGR|nr:hypothetical protein EUGRSUZ_L01431 [Eucalyptus grandis]
MAWLLKTPREIKASRTASGFCLSPIHLPVTLGCSVPSLANLESDGLPLVLSKFYFSGVRELVLASLTALG